MLRSDSNFTPQPDPRLIASGMADGMEHVAVNDRWTITHQPYRSNEVRFRFASYSLLGGAVLALAVPRPYRLRVSHNTLSIGQQQFSLLDAVGVSPPDASQLLNARLEASSTYRRGTKTSLGLDTNATKRSLANVITQACFDRGVFKVIWPLDQLAEGLQDPLRQTIVQHAGEGLTPTESALQLRLDDDEMTDHLLAICGVDQPTASLTEAITVLNMYQASEAIRAASQPGI